MNELDRCWKNCLRMWKWVSENLPEKFMGLNFDSRRTVVYALKEEWMERHQYKGIVSYCFFCHYVSNNNDSFLCGYCPARKVEYRLKNYWCERKYHWSVDPVNFYQYLLKLDAKRRG